MRHLLPRAIAAVLIGTVGLVSTSPAQTGASGHEHRARPDNNERAHPSLSQEYLEQMHHATVLPHVLAAPDDWPEGLFINSNTIDESDNFPLPQNESSIAVNPLDPSHLIDCAVDDRQGFPVYLSSDGGRNWRNVDLGVVHPNWYTGNDPSVAYDYLGNGYVMYGAFPDTMNGSSGVYVSRTSDDGATWQQHMVVIEHPSGATADTAFEDKYYLEIDNWEGSPYRGNLYTPWKRVIDRDSSTQIVFSRSTDMGETWSTPVDVSPRMSGTSTDTTFGQSFPISASGPDGTLYVAWNDGPARSIGFARSTDGGVTFSDPTYVVRSYATLGTARTVNGNTYHVLKGTFRAETYPTLDVDVSNSPRRGWVYLAWAAGREPDVFFSRSTDGGTTWSQPKVVESVTRNDQWWPWMSVDPTNGDIAIMYSDSRDDPNNVLVNQYVSYSSDGGSTWIDRRATDAVSDYRRNPFVDSIFAGDYAGNAFYNGRMYPSFLDTRNADVRLDNDVYTALLGVAQPMPVENLTARLDPVALDNVLLSWTNPPLESLFGKALNDYHILVTRDGVLLSTLDHDVVGFRDDSLEMGRRYRYTLYVATVTDTSAGRSVYVTGGGGAPLPPAVVEVRDYHPRVEFDVRMPTMRADSATPLVGLDRVRIFRDGTFLRDESVSSGDTGRVITIDDTPPERGYYHYMFSVVDATPPELESQPGDTVIAYAGTTDRYTESFDEGMPRYLVNGTWGVTNIASLSSPFSVTDSPGGDYRGSSNTWMQLFPTRANGGQQPTILTFRHIALVDPTDSAMVEASFDRGRTWSVLATYDSTDYVQWGDGSPDASDWRAEAIEIRNPMPSDTDVVVRFRLHSGTFHNADGWYIDDIDFGRFAGVHATGAANGLQATASPNPFSNTLLISYTTPAAGVVRVRLFDIVGREVAGGIDRMEPAGRHSTAIDASALSTGSYFYEVQTPSGVVRQHVLLVR